MQAVAQTPQLSEAERRLAQLETCPAFGDVDLTALQETAWVQPPSAIRRHRELRAASDLAVPETAPRILTHFTTFHHVSTDVSLAAARSGDGLWRVSAIGETRGPQANQPPSPVREEWTLSAAASAEVDAILVDPCFYAEPANVHAVRLRKLDGSEYQVIGGGISRTEIDTGDRQRIAEMHFGNWGRTGRLMYLIATKAR